MGNQEFTKMIIAPLHEALKPHGFRKKGTTFTKRVDDDVILIVNLQKSVSSNSELVKATVNLGVFSIPLAQQLHQSGWWLRTLDDPSEADCHWRQRIGFLLPERCDTWWEIRNASEAAAVGDGITEAVVRYALPALDEVAATTRLEALWASGRSASDRPSRSPHQR